MDVIYDESRKEFRIDLDSSTSGKGFRIFCFQREYFDRSLAYLTYEINGHTIDFQHTFVPSEYRGQGIAEKLVQVKLKSYRFVVIFSFNLECNGLRRKYENNRTYSSILFLCREISFENTAICSIFGEINRFCLFFSDDNNSIEMTAESLSSVETFVSSTIMPK